MLAIKLAQKGKTNKKMFRLIISEKGRDPYGHVLEILGSYNPHSKELVVKTERIKFWLSQGAQMTNTVNNLLIEKKIIEGKKIAASKAGQPNAKHQAQVKAKSDKKAASAKQPAATKEATTEATTETVAETVAEKPAEKVETAS